MLCETLRFRENDEAAFLDRFIQYAQLHRGVRGIAGQTWGSLKESPLGGLSHAHTQASSSKTKVQLTSVYAGPLESIKAAKLGAPLTVVYQQTITFLQITTHNLHYYRDLWIFGDAGKFLVESITKHLGPDWESWLGLPREVVNNQEHLAIQYERYGES
ncbi:hypothetical protein ABOM_003371 [Aspergillus bombycis]|uniref:Uncharacterized protein n=1 Tax=Aspergillus bombycis TaxID=109264 RepID=A0A1F8A9M9_9EURO|nr:hypothetical protein ABOM_003371 [Aspergillus bombycis]OGM48442.1 hypothetical protein ABOM_003371 [Aspergillus bombycis]